MVSFAVFFGSFIQGSSKRSSPAFVNFVAALAYLFCLALCAAFTQPVEHLLAKPCIQGVLKMGPRFRECEEKNCVLWPAAGRKTQFFRFLFTEPGAHFLAEPCTKHLVTTTKVRCIENGIESTILK